MSYRERITRPVTAPLSGLSSFTRKLTLVHRKLLFCLVDEITVLMSVLSLGRLAFPIPVYILLVYLRLRNSSSLMMLPRLLKPPFIDITE